MSAAAAVVVVGLALVAEAPLSAERAVELALESHPELSLLAERVREEEALRQGALALKNPQLRLRHTETERVLPPLWGEPLDPLPFDGSRVGLRWKPPGLESFGVLQRQGTRRVARRNAELEDARRAVVYEVRSLHARLLLLEQRLALAEEAVALSARVSALSERLLEERLATALEVSLARLDALDAVADRARLLSARREERVRLRTLLGLPESAPLSLAPPAEPVCRLPSLPRDVVVARAEERAPRLDGLRAEVGEEEARAFGYALQRVPWFDFLEVDVRPGQKNDHTSLGMRAGVELPLLDWKLSQTDHSRARKARLLAEHELERRALESRVLRVLEELEAKAELVSLYRGAKGGVLDEGLRQVQRALELGEVDAAKVALVQARALKAKRAALDAELDCTDAALRLSRLLGE